MKKIIKYFAVLLLFIPCLFIFTACGSDVTSVWGGLSNTQWYDKNETEFEIENAEDFAGIANLVNDNITDFSNCTIKLLVNIDLNNKNWFPIGNLSNAFKGTFDGNNCKISNLIIKNQKNENKDIENFGLFGVTNNAIIKNLLIENVDIENNSNNSNSTTAGIIGKAYNKTILTNVAVNNGTISGRDFVAGLIGNISTTDASPYDIRIVHCGNSANVISELKSGGIIGGISDKVNKYSNLLIKLFECGNSGNIQYTGKYANSLIEADQEKISNGSMIGYIDNGMTSEIELNECYNTGIITKLNKPFIGRSVNPNSYTQINCENLDEVPEDLEI